MFQVRFDALGLSLFHDVSRSKCSLHVAILLFFSVADGDDNILRCTSIYGLLRHHQQPPLHEADGDV